MPLKIISALIFILSLSAYAENIKVEIVRGTVLYYAKGQKKKRLKPRDIISKDGMIKTGKASFARVRFPNDSVLSIAPLTTLSLNHELKYKPKLVEIIRGKIRGTINPKIRPEKGYDHKMIVKTRSASVGVRGTDFIVVYNEKNHITSNITLRGEVDLFKKTDEEIYESIREEQDQNGRPVKLGQSDELLAIEDDLRNYRTERVPVGHFAGAFPSYEKTIRPVAISNLQLSALEKNRNLQIGIADSSKQKRRILKENIQLASNDIPQDDSLVPSPRRKERVDRKDYNSNKNDDGIRQGGLVDLNSGIYIAPPAGSPIDKKTGKYLMPDEFGGVDAETGEYIPPEGITLDPLHGFKYDERIPKDRNIKKNLQRLQNLTGSLYDQVGEVLDIFKEVTRLDLYGVANYRYVTNVIENYYGEFRRVTNDPSMMWDLQGYGGFQFFHNNRWLIYPKGSISARYYERALPQIKEQNMYTGMLGNEIHYKHSILGRKSRFVIDTEFTTRYMDFKRRNLMDFYTEDAGLKVMERMSLNRGNHLNLYYQIRAYHGYRDHDHGNIHNVGADHEFELGDMWSFIYGFQWSYRSDKIDDQRHQIFRGHSKFKWRDILPKSDLTFGYTYQYHKRRHREPFDFARYYMADILFHRRLNKFWKVNLLYSYDRQQAIGVVAGSEQRSFIRQSWGGGLTMKF